jgi:hypothetical protein
VEESLLGLIPPLIPMCDYKDRSRHATKRHEKSTLNPSISHFLNQESLSIIYEIGRKVKVTNCTMPKRVALEEIEHTHGRLQLINGMLKNCYYCPSAHVEIDFLIWVI